MTNIIAKKEFAQTLRDKRFWLVAILVWSLLISASVVGYVNYRKIQAERNQASETANELWLTQGDKNPHSAAHYGSFAYRPKSPLSFFDFGTDSFTGMSVRLEAHKQSDALFSAAQESSSLIRFGELTTAFILQLLLPLLVIFLCFNAFTKEREEKTLHLLLSQGVSMKQIAWGKIEGFSWVVACLALPALALVLVLFALQSSTGFSTDWLIRAIILVAIYVAYLFVFVTLSVWVSAKANSSKSALLSLLVVWIFACVVVPKAVVNVASSSYPVPSSLNFRKAIKDDVAQGINGHDPKDERAKELKEKVFAEYGVESADELPINFDAVQMQEGEIYSAMVYQKHFTELQETYQSQNRVSEWLGVVNPFLAMRHLSMTLSGSDYVAHADFQKQAETYRFEMVELLNNYMRDNSKTGDWYFTVNDEVWSQMPPFEYQEPALGGVLSRSALSIFAVLVWVALGSLAISKLDKSVINA